MHSNTVNSLFSYFNKTYWDRRTTITSMFLCLISLKLVFNLILFSTEQYVYNTFLSYLPLQANRNFLFTRKGCKSSILWINEKYGKKFVISQKVLSFVLNTGFRQEVKFQEITQFNEIKQKCENSSNLIT